MDEIEFLKKFKKMMKIAVFICLGINIFLLLMMLYILSFHGAKVVIEVFDIFIQMNSYMIPLFVLPFVIIYLILEIRYRMQKKKVGRLKLSKEYIREVPISYSPAIASYIHDYRIETYADYTATTLYLCTKGYIKLVNQEDNYIYEVLKTDLSNLSLHEQYAYECIVQGAKFDETAFKKLVIKDAQDIEMLTHKKKKFNWVIFSMILLILVIAICIVAAIAKKNNLFHIFWGGLTMIGMIVYLIMDLFPYISEIFSTDKYYLTKAGEEERQNLMQLKNFMKECTLIKEKNAEYIKILEEYIPYALALGEASTVEKFIVNNDTYRRFIYKRK